MIGGAPSKPGCIPHGIIGCSLCVLERIADALEALVEASKGGRDGK